MAKVSNKPAAFDAEAAVIMIVQLSVQGAETSLGVRGNMVNLIRNGAKDSILRAAERVAAEFRADQTRRNTALSGMRVQLGRAFDSLKAPRQSFKIVGGVAIWKSAPDKPAIDWLQKVRDAVLLATEAEALTVTQAEALLAIVDGRGEVQTATPTVVSLPTDRPTGRRRTREAEAMAA